MLLRSIFSGIEFSNKIVFIHTTFSRFMPKTGDSFFLSEFYPANFFFFFFFFFSKKFLSYITLKMKLMSGISNLKFKAFFFFFFFFLPIMMKTYTNLCSKESLKLSFPPPPIFENILNFLFFL